MSTESCAATSADEGFSPVIYQELRRLAASYMRRQPASHTLQPTALVHEAYFRLAGSHFECRDRGHFFRTAACAMRQILVDHARSRSASKRGGQVQRVEFDEFSLPINGREILLIRLDDALGALARSDPRKAQIIELRYFGGLSIEEVAQTLDISTATVGREVRYAETWLSRQLNCA